MFFCIVWTAGISEGPEQWPNNYFYSSCVDNKEEQRPVMVSSDIKINK